MTNAKAGKPKCGKGQSCGYACIEASDLCKEKVDQAAADAIIAAVKSSGMAGLRQFKQESLDSFTNKGDASLSVEELVKKYPQSGIKFLASQDLGNGIERINIRAEASDGSGDTMQYSAIRHNGEVYTVSDGRLKLVTSGTKRKEWYEAQLASFRALTYDPAKAVSQVKPDEPKADEAKLLPKASSEPDLSKPWSRIFADQADDSPLPVPPSWAMSEIGGDGAKAILAELDKDSSLSKSDKLSMAAGLKSWLGAGYTKMSPLTYQAADDTDVKDFDSKSKALELAVRALKAMPAVTEASQLAAWKASSQYKNAPDEESLDSLNRWIRAADLGALLSRYKEGEVISEDGMFGTTHLDADEMDYFSRGANVQYIVKPKLDGTGGGRSVDSYKNQAYEGEVLYVPGTRFRVSKVEASDSLPAPTYLSVDLQAGAEQAKANAKANVEMHQAWADSAGQAAFENPFSSEPLTISKAQEYADGVTAMLSSGELKAGDSPVVEYKKLKGKQFSSTLLKYVPGTGKYEVDYLNLNDRKTSARAKPSLVYLEEV